MKTRSMVSIVALNVCQEEQTESSASDSSSDNRRCDDDKACSVLVGVFIRKDTDQQKDV